MAEKVRYRVLGKTYVNDTYIDPSDPNAPGVERVGKNCFVWAAPGLEGPALELAKGKAAETKPPEGNSGGASS
ncbi:protein of unknown function [Hyphomicrobium sp. 1Nfss2.1]|uniref:hypothetical protein n=1 Tax=Hyphomicrobium sp. 1Nfss2.1 TaxID=3413936 RepID=UPI003C7DCE19